MRRLIPSAARQRVASQCAGPLGHRGDQSYMGELIAERRTTGALRLISGPRAPNHTATLNPFGSSSRPCGERNADQAIRLSQ
jgi:hypothetical protein